MTALIDYLPRYYYDSYVVGNLMGREQGEIDAIKAAASDVLAQYFVDTATWGLARWETVLGITVDETKPTDQRRSVIKSKLRGIGTVTPALIKNVAEAYSNGQVSVTENNAAYTVTITFISDHGVPANLSDVQAAIRAVLPAHLGITFEFNYLLFSELDALNWKFADLDSRNLTFAQLEVYG